MFPKLTMVFCCDLLGQIRVVTEYNEGFRGCHPTVELISLGESPTLKSSVESMRPFLKKKTQKRGRLRTSWCKLVFWVPAMLLFGLNLILLDSPLLLFDFMLWTSRSE